MTKPGLQVERTALAWTRTAASAGGLGALTLKLGVSHHNVAEILAAICLLGAALQLGRPHKHLRVAQPVAAPTLVRATAVGVVAAALAAGLAALLG